MGECGAVLEYAGRGRPPKWCRVCNYRRAKERGET